jgi:uncharacterized protein (TIGR03790 family)
MPISKNNFIVVYRIDDAESREFAEYYADKHDMLYGDSSYIDSGNKQSINPSEYGPIEWEVDGQLVGVACSDDEILLGEDTFNEEVLTPLQNALDGRVLSRLHYERIESSVGSSLSSFASLITPFVLGASGSDPIGGDWTIWGVVLGYNVPGGFTYGDSSIDIGMIGDLAPPYTLDFGDDGIISSTSRVSRGLAKNTPYNPSEVDYYSFNAKTRNKLYKRSVFKRFDSDDVQYSLICSRIDAPTLTLAKQYVDQGELLNKQLYVDGTFYIDPYSDRAGYFSSEYTESILDFYNTTLEKLNLNTWTTEFMDEYIDVNIPFVNRDSFVWSWFSDRATSDFFETSNGTRAFFYNADYDGAETIRDADGDRWPILSLNAGYAATAGSMSNPGIDGFLDPNSLFYALAEGASMGEAYLFSLPYVDWTVTSFGDPLTYVSFPISAPSAPPDVIPGDPYFNDSIIYTNSSWDRMSKNLARVAANLYEKANEIESIRDTIVNQLSENTDFELAVLYKCQDWYSKNDDRSKNSQLIKVTSSLFQYPEKIYIDQGLSQPNPTIDDFLTETGIKVSRLLTEISSESLISESNLLDEGWWEFDFILQDDAIDFVNYYFVLEVYDSSSFSHEHLVVSVDSNNANSWYYEKENNIFEQIPTNGVPSSYIGRRIRYISRKDTSIIKYNEYLERGKTYYFRVRQYITYPSLVEYIYRDYTDIIYT